MKKTIIYGASDDLVEIDGAINEEVGFYDSQNDPIKIRTSDGTVATIYYDGGWHINVKKGGPLFERIVHGIYEDDSNHHGDPEIESICKSVPLNSDVMVLAPGVKWVCINDDKFKL